MQSRSSRSIVFEWGFLRAFEQLQSIVPERQENMVSCFLFLRSFIPDTFIFLLLGGRMHISIGCFQSPCEEVQRFHFDQLWPPCFVWIDDWPCRHKLQRLQINLRGTHRIRANQFDSEQAEAQALWEPPSECKPSTPPCCRLSGPRTARVQVALHYMSTLQGQNLDSRSFQRRRREGRKMDGVVHGDRLVLYMFFLSELVSWMSCIFRIGLVDGNWLGASSYFEVQPILGFPSLPVRWHGSGICLLLHHQNSSNKGHHNVLALNFEVFRRLQTCFML